MVGLLLWLQFQSQPFENRTIHNLCFLTRFQIVFDKIAAICPNFKKLGFRISDPILNTDHLQPQPLFFHLKSILVRISDPQCTIFVLFWQWYDGDGDAKIQTTFWLWRQVGSPALQCPLQQNHVSNFFYCLYSGDTNQNLDYLESGFQIADPIWMQDTFMLTLESLCMPVVMGLVLNIRTLISLNELQVIFDLAVVDS